MEYEGMGSEVVTRGSARGSATGSKKGCAAGCWTGSGAAAGAASSSCGKGACFLGDFFGFFFMNAKAPPTPRQIQHERVKKSHCHNSKKEPDEPESWEPKLLPEFIDSWPLEAGSCREPEFNDAKEFPELPSPDDEAKESNGVTGAFVVLG